MKTLVVGATGATGRWLTHHLLEKGRQVKAIVRSPDKFPAEIRNHAGLTVIQASLLELSDEALQQHVHDCESIASCLGHNLTFKGIFGQPRQLVTDSVKRLTQAARAARPTEVTKFVLMNTVGYHNQKNDLPISSAQQAVLAVLRALLPPHRDNELAAEYFYREVGQDDSQIQWVVVRPDGLIDDESVTEYQPHPHPMLSAIFDSGKTSRVNVGHFMASLITEPELWSTWKGKLPAVYNASSLQMLGERRESA